MRRTELAGAATIAIVMALVGVPASAATTTLDHGFGDAFRRYSFRHTVDDSVGIVIRPTGQMVLGASIGRVSPPNERDAGLLQLTSSGTPDPAFGDHGHVIAPLSTSEFLESFALDPDGSIVGLTEDSASNTGTESVFRIKTNGSPDLNFGTNGVEALALAPGERVQTVAVEPTHEIVLGGWLGDGTGRQTDVRRLTKTGAFDGQLSLGFGVSASEATSIGVSPNGSHVIVETRMEDAGAGKPGIGLWMLDGGTLDPKIGFGDSTGRAFITDPNGVDAGAAIVDNAGVVTASGDFTSPAKKVLVERLTASGTPQQSFGTHGATAVPIPGGFAFGPVQSLIKDAQGRLVVEGRILTDGVGVARLLANGHLDTSFGNGGVVSMDTPEVFFASGAAIDPSGRLLIAGGESRQVLIRLTQSGALDETFHAGGLTVYPENIGPGQRFQSVGAALLPGGQIYLAGSLMTSTTSVVRVMRLAPNGYRDVTYGRDEGGVANYLGQADTFAQGVAVDSHGRAVITGCSSCSTQSSALLVTRFQTAGNTDPSFGGSFDGASIGFASAARGFAIAVDTDDSVIAAGTEGSQIALVHLTSTGQPDTSFSSDGKTTITFPGASAVNAAAVAIQPDHKILVAGTFADTHSERFAVARFKPDGTLDGTFGTGGRVTTAFPAGSAEAVAMALGPNGTIVVVGHVTTPNDSRIGVARYLSNGHPDTSLGGTGRSLKTLPSGDEFPAAVLVDGTKTVVAGTRIAIDGTISLEVARFNNNGSLDTTFNGTGVDLVSTLDHDAAATGLVRNAAGDYIVTGYAPDAFGGTFMAAVRFAP
jgi:uncharacterized delta-60 repeat protein